MRRGAFVLAAALTGGLAIGAARGESACLRGPVRDWHYGPVRYLLTEDEWQRFGRLETDAARAGFVSRFWKHLDSDRAASSDQSFREQFEARCLDAESRFLGENPPGWRSDHGRVLLLLGEPAAIERLPGEAESIDREIWVYPYPAGGASSSLRIPFYRTFEGRIQLEPPRATETVGTRIVFDAVRRRARRSRSPDYPRGTAAGAMIDAILSRPTMEVPPRPLVVVPSSRKLEDDETAAASTLRDGVWFFQTSDDTVLALLAVTLAPGSGLDEASVRGSAFVLEGAAGGAGDGTAQLELTAVPASGQSPTVHVGRVLLEPRSAARIRYAFTDASQRTMLVRSRNVEVPELGTGEFSVSSVVPAETFGPLPKGGDSVFAVGSETVVPRPEASFARGETLRLYLQVYGAQADPARGLPRVDVEFLFFRREDGRRPKRQGPPLRLRGAFGASLGLSIPIGDWPAGAYSVEVSLRDRVAGRVAEAEGKFRVTE